MTLACCEFYGEIIQELLDGGEWGLCLELKTFVMPRVCYDDLLFLVVRWCGR